MSLPNGASFAAGEVERIEAGLAELAKDPSAKDAKDRRDPHAPREISVRVILHAHREYPKVLYKGVGVRDAVQVADEEAEQAAIDRGYGDHVPEPQDE